MVAFQQWSFIKLLQWPQGYLQTIKCHQPAQNYNTPLPLNTLTPKCYTRSNALSIPTERPQLQFQACSASQQLSWDVLLLNRRREKFRLHFSGQERICRHTHYTLGVQCQGQSLFHISPSASTFPLLLRSLLFLVDSSLKSTVLCQRFILTHALAPSLLY